VRLDRRVPFFLLVAVLCFALVPLADKGLRHIPIAIGITYVVLALAFLLDWMGRRSSAVQSAPGRPDDDHDDPL